MPQVTVSQEVRLNFFFQPFALQNLLPPVMGWSCQFHCGFSGSCRFCTCGNGNESCKLWAFFTLVGCHFLQNCILNLSEEAVLYGEKLGHLRSGTGFLIPASKVLAEATRGWVSYCSMHYFFDGCRWTCCVAATKGHEREGMHFLLSNNNCSSTCFSCNCYYVNTTSNIPTEIWMA